MQLQLQGRCTHFSLSASLVVALNGSRCPHRPSLHPACLCAMAHACGFACKWLSSAAVLSTLHRSALPIVIPRRSAHPSQPVTALATHSRPFTACRCAAVAPILLPVHTLRLSFAVHRHWYSPNRRRRRHHLRCYAHQRVAVTHHVPTGNPVVHHRLFTIVCFFQPPSMHRTPFVSLFLPRVLQTNAHNLTVNGSSTAHARSRT